MLLGNKSQDLVIICDYEPGVDTLLVENDAVVTVIGLTELGLEISLHPDGDVAAFKGIASVDQLTFLSSNPINYQPDAADDAVVTSEDMAITIDVRANDSDPDGDTVWVAETTQGANGTVVIEADGRVSYTPNAGFSGTDSFTYELSDVRGGFDVATVEVVVEPEERPEPAYVLLKGDNRNNVLRGEDDQNDKIHGFGGDDRIYGASGNDLLIGGRGNDKLRGNEGDDTLIDGKGNDRMFGGAGDDTLVFRGGAVDRAWGGSGADTFVFGDAFIDNGRADWAKIYGFDASMDMLDLDRGDINSVAEFRNKVILTLGPDDDRIVLNGIGDFDELTFVDDLMV